MWLDNVVPMREILEKYFSLLQVVVGTNMAGGIPSSSQ